MRTKPPSCADGVGSQLRWVAIKDAREKHEHGEIDGNQVREVEAQESPAIIRKEEEVGLKAVTDADYWQFSGPFEFLAQHANAMPKMCIPSPSVLIFLLRRWGTPQDVAGYRRVRRRSGRGVRQNRSAILRCDLPLPPARRHGLDLSACKRRTRKGPRTGTRALVFTAAVP